MNTIDNGDEEILAAIEQSIAQNRRVVLIVDDSDDAIERLYALSDDYESTFEWDGSIDFWGRLEGRDFRLTLTERGD